MKCYRRSRIVELAEQAADVAPRQLAHSLWANLAVRPTSGELAHVL
jgi:hypothetical protein